MAYTEEELKKELESKEYAYGFYTDIESDTFPVGLNEDGCSCDFPTQKRARLDDRMALGGYEAWSAMEEPDWANVDYPKPDFQAISYFSAPKKAPKYNSLDEVDPELLDTFKKLGIPLKNKKNSRVLRLILWWTLCLWLQLLKKPLPKKASFSVRFQKRLKNTQIWCASTSEQWCHAKTIITLPSTRQYFLTGRFAISPKVFAAQWNSPPIFVSIKQEQGSLNVRSSLPTKAVMWVIWKDVLLPLEMKINCMQLWLNSLPYDHAEIKYSTVQNWFPGDAEGKGGVFNFVTKRGICHKSAKISWTQVETGSAVTWKYPSCILKGDDSIGEFYSIAVTNNRQQADTGTKMVHLGKRTKSTIISKGISAGTSQNSYRGLGQNQSPSRWCA